MKKVQAFLGYSAAGLMIPLIIAGFMLTGVPGFDEMIVSATGLRLAPSIDGGEVVQTIDHGAYRTDVHRMVFDALIGERREGFIQLDWAPLGSLPAHIDEEIDADGDGRADFRIDVDTEAVESTLTPYAPWVLALEGTYTRQGSVAVRVRLENPAR
jgi:hypothetical protein